MIFKGEPNLQIQKRVRKQGRGGFKNIVIGNFDENGLFESNDESLVERLKVHFEVFEQEKQLIEPSDDDIRQFAKEKGIKSWHVKSIAKLKDELEGLPDEV